jgi:hypothetical protein
MFKLLLLDLEETLVDDWDAFNPVRVPQVSKFIQSQEWDAIGLFSFAVWDANDMVKFEFRHRKFLEEVFGFKFTNEFLWSVEDLKSLLRFVTTVDNTEDDFVWQWSKEWALMCLSKLKQLHDTEVTLLDDTVRNMTVELPDTNSRLIFVNVKTL